MTAEDNSMKCLFDNLPDGLKSKVTGKITDIEEEHSRKMGSYADLLNLKLDDYPDTDEGLDFFFVQDFLTKEMHFDFYAIAEDFFKNCPDLPRQLNKENSPAKLLQPDSLDDPLYCTAVEGDDFKIQLMHYIYYGYKQGNEFCRKQLISLYKTYYKKEYNSLKKIQVSYKI